MHIHLKLNSVYHIMKNKLHMMHLPLKLDFVYHMWITMSLESFPLKTLPLKVRFLPLETVMETKAMAPRCDSQQDNLKNNNCQGHIHAFHHEEMGHNKHQINRLRN